MDGKLHAGGTPRVDGAPRTDGAPQGAAAPRAARTLRAVFMGTPEFALGALRALHGAPFVEVALVVTRPDAASGRGKALLPSPVKALARELGYPVLETKTLRTSEVQARLAEAGADVFCVAAFGAILPREVIEMPPLGCLNVHASLLPRGRGAAPMQRALLEGEPRLGYSIMRIEEGLDTGPYCIQGSVEVGERTYPEVSAELSDLGGAALVEALRSFVEGDGPAWTAQDDALATHADKIAKAEVLLDPTASADVNMHRVQASSDAAPARCSVAGRTLRVVRAHRPGALELVDLAADGCALPSAGGVLCSHGRVLLGCSEGVLELLEVKPDGKRAMAASEFAAGVRGADASWEAI